MQKIMSSIKTKNNSQKLSFKLIPYLFITVAIFAAFGSSGGRWVWLTQKSMEAMRWGQCRPRNSMRWGQCRPCWIVIVSVCLRQAAELSALMRTNVIKKFKKSLVIIILCMKPSMIKLFILQVRSRQKKTNLIPSLRHLKEDGLRTSKLTSWI